MSIPRPYRVLIHVQHLLGVGHLQRALRLAEALVRRGLRVDLVSGGKAALEPADSSIRFHQLPPASSADGSFSRILDEHGNCIDETWKTMRRERLLALFDEVSPHVLITETFPFGRRMLSFELVPLLERARERQSPVLIVSSIRDILQPKRKPEREREVLDRIETFYDHVLVHGDARIAGLDLSFAASAQISDQLFYSGYICADSDVIDDGGEADEVLVSAGGSDTGYAILETALEAKPRCRLARSHWRILVSPAIDETRYRRLLQAQANGIVVERNRADFGALMRRARLSISQAGYNTMTDILRAGIPAVVIPYAEAEEVEQSLRARAFGARRRVIALEQRGLNAASLAAAIDATDDLDTGLEVDLDGAAASAAQIETWLGELHP